MDLKDRVVWKIPRVSEVQNSQRQKESFRSLRRGLCRTDLCLTAVRLIACQSLLDKQLPALPAWKYPTLKTLLPKLTRSTSSFSEKNKIIKCPHPWKSVLAGLEVQGPHQAMLKDSAANEIIVGTFKAHTLISVLSSPDQETCYL